ncbi:MAG TPA: hypothetical protein VKZ53_13375 [Candidatus Angelobacter sp.]|nr:hypothetical protein [Candidatus Angelobacter sp.]
MKKIFATLMMACLLFGTVSAFAQDAPKDKDAKADKKEKKAKKAKKDKKADEKKEDKKG